MFHLAFCMYSTSVIVLVFLCFVFFFFKQKTAYEMRISDWSSDVCSSDLIGNRRDRETRLAQQCLTLLHVGALQAGDHRLLQAGLLARGGDAFGDAVAAPHAVVHVDEEPLDRRGQGEQLERIGNARGGGRECTCAVISVCRQKIKKK